MSGPGLDRAPTRRATAAVPAVTAAAAAAAAGVQYLPAVSTLGAWTSLETLPGRLCRWRGPRWPGSVSLTFDDGPHPVGTPAVLDRLDALGLRGTFFCVGWRAERDPGAVAEIRRRGHVVGTHGYAHVHHLARGPRWVRRDLERADAAMAGAGMAPRWFRPPYGQVTGATLGIARARGWETVLWSAWGREWATPDPAAVAARVTRRLRPGAVVLLHDSDAYGPQGTWRVVVEALGPIAEELDRREMRAVTLDELVP